MIFGLRRLSCCLVIGLAASVAVADDSFKAAADRLPAAIERARALGLPFSLEELNRGRSVPNADENAAETVLALGRELDKQSGGWADIATLEKLAVKKEMGPVRNGLKAYQVALELSEKATRYQRLDFGRDWDFGWKTSFGEYATIKQAARLLGIRAQVKAAAGDVSGVLADLGRIHTFAQLIADERTLVGVEVSMATLEVGEKAAERVAALWVNNDDRLERLEKFLAAPVRLPSLTDAARGDFYMGVASARNLGDLRTESYREDLGKAFGKKWESASIVRDGIPQSLVAQAILTRHIESWLAIWPQLTSDDNALKRISAIDAIVTPDEHDMDPLNYIFELLHVSETAVQAPAAEIDILARGACTRTLVAALRYKIANGHYPATSADLAVHETDPWSGGPIRIWSNNEQIRAYSVGPDGKDDDGKTYVELPKQPTLDFDISWARFKGDIVASYPALIPRTNPVKG